MFKDLQTAINAAINWMMFLTIIMRPIIFTFNIRRSVFESFGLTFFEHLRKIRVNDQSLTLLPIVTTPYDNIEARAQELARKLPLLMRELSV